MSGSNQDLYSQISANFFEELVDSVIIDVASEYHRIAKLGLDHNLDEEEEELRLSAEACAKVANPSYSSSTGGETTSKYVVDIFGQTHPTVASEIFECMNCGRSVVAGRFAPHLEKCMGKGRKARLKVTRSSAASQTRHSPYSSANRLANGSPGEHCSNGAAAAAEEP